MGAGPGKIPGVEGLGWSIVAILLMVVVLILLVVFQPRAHAHDKGAPNWITEGKYVSPETGVHCCGPNDCDRLDPKTIEATPAGFILHAFNDEFVPYSEATPSEDGQFWRCHAYTGTRRCFFAPVGTQ